MYVTLQAVHDSLVNFSNLFAYVLAFQMSFELVLGTFKDFDGCFNGFLVENNAKILS